MSVGLIQYNNLYFTTSTIVDWNNLLLAEENVQVILETFHFLHRQKKFNLYAFVIMPNHMHLLYEVLPDSTDDGIKHSILSYSSKLILENIPNSEKDKYLVNKSDRKYQIWKSPSLSVEIITKKFLLQKLNYIHNNPSSIGCNPENYILSSYPSYLCNEPLFDFLTLW